MLARRLVEAGVRLVTVMYSGSQGWDNHTRIKDAVSEGHAGLRPRLLRADHGPGSARAAGFHAGDGDQRIRAHAEGEREWRPRSLGARAIRRCSPGGGITRGQIYGASNATAAEPDRDPVTVENFLATVYHQLGVNAEDRLLAPGGRPIDIVRDGKFVEGLCAS